MGVRATIRSILVVAVLACTWASPRSAGADALDEAFARGNEAAAAGQWSAAVEAYERAAALSPERNALVSYNLGTAYAHTGDLGRAVYHLARATDFRGGPTADVLQAARDNLEVVRRRIELQATTHHRIVDRPATSWDLLVEALRARGVGWLALLAGWALVAGLAIEWRRRARGPSRHAGFRAEGVTGAVLVVLAVLYAVPGFLHGWALRADREAPEAIVLPEQIEVREGPGNHRAPQFTVQGGSRVRIEERAPGWVRVWLPGGLVGWVPDASVGLIDASKAVAPAVVPASAKSPSR